MRLIDASLDVEALQERLAQLEEDLASPDLYRDGSRSARVMKEKASVEGRLEGVHRLSSQLAEWREMHELARMEGDEEMARECVGKVGELWREARALRADVLLDGAGEAASASCFLEVQAGAGGTESCDWASMLLRMYTRWADRRGFEVRPISTSPGEEAGVRSAMVLIDGPSAYGWLRAEAGVHRLVRISPYDAAGRRHTSFAQVRLYPESAGDGSGKGGDAAAVELPAKDLRVETMRAQGAGGQHVNTTDSAVRITHLPTGIVAQSQAERSQHRNREAAERVLRAKLRRLEEEAAAAARREHASGLGENAWGGQIRSYVLAPYRMVKDHRTGAQAGDVDAVLGGGGGLDEFIEAGLAAAAE